MAAERMVMDIQRPTRLGRLEPVRSGRGARGRLVPGGPSGPGRPRKGRRSPRALVMFEALQGFVNSHLEENDGFDLEDFLGACELLVRRARFVARTAPEGRKETERHRTRPDTSRARGSDDSASQMVVRPTLRVPVWGGWKGLRGRVALDTHGHLTRARKCDSA